MSLKRAKRLKNRQVRIELKSHIAREVQAVIYAGLAAIAALVINGNAGILGQWLNQYLRLGFGVGAYLLPFIFGLFSLTLFLSRRIEFNAARHLGILLLLVSGLGLVQTQVPIEKMLDRVELAGGYTGFLISVLPRIFLSDLGAQVILVAGFLVGFLITFEISLKDIISFFYASEPLAREKEPDLKLKLLRQAETLNIIKPQAIKTAIKKDADAPIAINKPEPLKRSEKKEEITEDDTDYSGWELPSLDLLNASSSEVFVSDKVLKENAERIREKLGQFGIEVTMRDVNIGPTVVQYTLQPSEGVKLTKITTLKDDLALALAAKSVRIEAPIPGKALVGIEVPSEKRMTVHLREMLESEEFLSIQSRLRLCVGRDVSGAPVIDDLASMPHLLVAGATGAGKSVGMNTFLLSLLYQNSPQDLRFIMVDPKRVELTTYNGIPHLLTPVITQPEKAHAALKWAVGEMNRRYQLLADKGYRNLEEYNAAEARPLHKIIIVIDELADLMMQAQKKETEALICRIAQMARAVGMHLILATQRPSVDVITGLIKANIPTRIAFTVTSGVDSRTIIDSIGAEDLLGMGDMLYLPGNRTKPIRVQGVYVSSKEIERVTNRLKLMAPRVDEIMLKDENDKTSEEGAAPFIPTGGIDLDAAGAQDGPQDDLYEQAIVVIKETKKASASLLQRRLSIGYARAARLLDVLEQKGAIGPVNGAKAREIYL